MSLAIATATGLVGRWESEKLEMGARDTLVELEVTGVGATGFANQLELNTTRVRCRREISLLFIRRRHANRIDVLALLDLEFFPGAEEEDLVLQCRKRRSAYRKTVLVLLENGHASQKIGNGIKVIVPQVVVRASMVRVRPGFCDHVRESSGQAAEFDVAAGTQELNFLNCIGIGRCAALIAPNIVVKATIDEA